MGFVVAIDGPAASGKGSIAERLGRAWGWPVLDTGLLYRAVGHETARRGLDLDDGDIAGAVARTLDLDDLEAAALRTREAAEAASRVAVHPAVRAALLEAQRRFAAREPGAVLDGRDIGTVVVPAAPCKIFVTATAAVRARRRHAQLASQPGETGGDAAGYEAVLEDILRRDERDGGRAAAPLRRAPDAALLDTTDLDIEQAFDAALRIVEASRGRWDPT
jgi:cytidylate kinase